MIVSGMTMEEIFKERQIFKNKVIENVQAELDQFGLKIYNANVKELQDTAGSEYFKFLSRKAHEGASNQAKVDVANACMMGEIGVCIPSGQAHPYADHFSGCKTSSGSLDVKNPLDLSHCPDVALEPDILTPNLL